MDWKHEKKIKRVTIVDTFIPEDNERKDNTVEMGKKGVKEYLKSLRTKTNGLLRYIGEWHTHIAGDASPSQKDLKTFCETHPAEDVFFNDDFITFQYSKLFLSEGRK